MSPAQIWVPFTFSQCFIGIPYWYTSAHVMLGKEMSKSCGVNTGVMKGCVLAPVIFNLCLVAVSLVFRHNISALYGVPIKYRLHGSLFNIRCLQAVAKVTNDTIFILQYADDADLSSHMPDGLQQQMYAISSAYSCSALVVNPKRWKSFTSHQIRHRPQPCLSVGINLASLNSSCTWKVSLPPHVISLQKFNAMLT